jgi:hypothetical protein
MDPARRRQPTDRQFTSSPHFIFASGRLDPLKSMRKLSQRAKKQAQLRGTAVLEAGMCSWRVSVKAGRALGWVEEEARSPTNQERLARSQVSFHERHRHHTIDGVIFFGMQRTPRTSDRPTVNVKD